MSDGQALFILLSAVAITSIVFYNFVNLIIGMLFYYTQYNKGPRAHKVNHETLCKDPHRWENVKLAIRQVPYDNYDICSECGFISGTDYQLNKSGLAQLNESKEKLKIQDEERKLLELRIAGDLESHRDRWINGNLQNLIRLAKNETPDGLKENLKYFFKYALEIEKEILEKIKDEREAQRQLNSKYKDWGRH